MAPRGRKPKPTGLKLVTGNPGKRALNKAEPKPTSPLGEPPAHLSKDAIGEWDRVSGELASSKIATGLDVAALAAYCQAFGRWAQAERALAKMSNQADGLIIKTVSGNMIQNPLVGVANKAMADMVRYAAEFGMTPSARSRVEMVGGGAEENPFALLG